jgi:hypothetical protein
MQHCPSTADKLEFDLYIIICGRIEYSLFKRAENSIYEWQD